MIITTTTLTRGVTAAAMAATLLAAGCAREAGSQMATTDFGNPTMNNQLVQTCQVGPVAEGGKYAPTGGACPGRNWDGKYAQVTYDNYVTDAAPLPPITTGFD